MDSQGIRQFLGHKCTRIVAGGVNVVDSKGNETVLQADTVCYSVGMKSNTDAVESLKQAAGNVPVFVIGDCTAVGKVANATEFAYKAAMEIV